MGSLRGVLEGFWEGVLGEVFGGFSRGSSERVLGGSYWGSLRGILRGSRQGLSSINMIFTFLRSGIESRAQKTILDTPSIWNKPASFRNPRPVKINAQPVMLSRAAFTKIIRKFIIVTKIRSPEALWKKWLVYCFCHI